MPITIDMGGVEEGGFAALEPGVYEAKLTKIELKGPGPSGHKYLEFTFKPEGQAGQLWRNYSLSPKALWALKTDLKAAFDVEVPDGEFEFEPEDIIGLDCSVKVSQRSWNGRMTNDVDAVLPAGSGGDESFDWKG